jgi:hypothetical protein
MPDNVGEEPGVKDYLGDAGKLNSATRTFLAMASGKATQLYAAIMSDLDLSAEQVIENLSQIVSDNRDVYLAAKTLGIDPAELINVDLSKVAAEGGITPEYITSLLREGSAVPEDRQIEGQTEQTEPEPGYQPTQEIPEPSGKTVTFGSILSKVYAIRKNSKNREKINRIVAGGKDKVFTQYLEPGQRMGHIVDESYIQIVNNHILELLGVESKSKDITEASGEEISYSFVLTRMPEYRQDGGVFLEAANKYTETDTVIGKLVRQFRKRSYKLDASDRQKVENRVRKLYGEPTLTQKKKKKHTKPSGQTMKLAKVFARHPDKFRNKNKLRQRIIDVADTDKVLREMLQSTGREDSYDLAVDDEPAVYRRMLFLLDIKDDTVTPYGELMKEAGYTHAERKEIQKAIKTDRQIKELFIISGTRVKCPNENVDDAIEALDKLILSKLGYVKEREGVIKATKPSPPGKKNYLDMPLGTALGNFSPLKGLDKVFKGKGVNVMAREKLQAMTSSGEFLRSETKKSTTTYYITDDAKFKQATISVIEEIRSELSQTGTLDEKTPTISDAPVEQDQPPEPAQTQPKDTRRDETSYDSENFVEHGLDEPSLQEGDPNEVLSTLQIEQEFRIPMDEFGAIVSGGKYAEILGSQDESDDATTYGYKRSKIIRLQARLKQESQST